MLLKSCTLTRRSKTSWSMSLLRNQKTLYVVPVVFSHQKAVKHLLNICCYGNRCSFLKQINPLSKLFKSSSISGTLFGDVPWNYALQWNITPTWPGVSGWYTPKMGRCHHFSSSSSAGASSLPYPNIASRNATKCSRICSFFSRVRRSERRRDWDSSVSFGSRRQCVQKRREAPQLLNFF